MACFILGIIPKQWHSLSSLAPGHSPSPLLCLEGQVASVSWRWSTPCYFSVPGSSFCHPSNTTFGHSHIAYLLLDLYLSVL
jgi:hypothetical protein